MCTTVFYLYGQTGSAVFISGAEKEIPVQDLKSDPQGGISFTAEKKSVKLASGAYVYAWVPKPPEIIDADQKLQKEPGAALKKYMDAEEKYKVLGWNIYCMAGRARALAKLNRLREAIVLLEHASQYKLYNPRQMAHKQQIERLNVEFRIALKDYSGAEKLLNAQTDDISMTAFYTLQKGIIRREQKKTQEALTCFLITGFLYPETPEAPHALYEIWEILSAKKDPRAQRFREILTQRYPEFHSVRVHQ